MSACTPSPSSKGWLDGRAWVMCGCQWFTDGHVSMRKAKRAFSEHLDKRKHAVDPS